MAKQALEKIRGTVGLWSHAHETVPPGRSGELASLAESLGFGAYWLPESLGREALVSSTLLLEATSTMVVGTAIASIFARDAVASINGARTLAAASSDRFVLGLGVSHKPLVEDLRGHSYDRPLAAMERYLDAMEGVTMRSPEGDAEAPVLLAALGPKMLRLSATKADGAIPYLVTPEHTALARAEMGEQAFLVVEQGVALTEDAETFHGRASTHLASYLALPNYTRNLRRLGFGDDDLRDGGSARLHDALVAHGDESAIWARLDEHVAAGADHVCLQILGASFAEPPLDDWRRLAPSSADR